MELKYDPEKNARNVRLRGISFEKAAEFAFETALTIEDDREDYGETRYISLGLIGSTLHSLVFTVRGEVIRVISLRRANSRERMRYAEAQA